MSKMFLTFFLLIVSFIGYSQSDNPAVIYRSNLVTDRMNDSLFLSPSQKDSIWSMTARLLRETELLFSQQMNSDSLKKSIQLVENKRDGLYKTVLTDEQFLKYKKHKVNIVYGDNQ
ncbi:hypothetical protein [Gynurincola endophyticus]|uniref:hypothetical protein n=1 Tax=Gynurincola endophyticus TaxID=2479004 RepID=UPI000F8F383D|nr:hypothetical protein [Gynurincola endophyticus]